MFERFRKKSVLEYRNSNNSDPREARASNFKRVPILFFLIPIILVVFGLGFYFGKSQVVCEVCAPQQVDFSLFWETWNAIHEKFVDKAKINTQDLIYGAISGMVNSLDDPYTVFLTPENSKRFVEDVQGSFEGVGMEIDVRKGQLQVVSPLEGTPAQKAGLLAGDKIIKINGTSTVDMTTDEAVNLIRGPKGTEVILNIFRDGWEETKDITVIRDVIIIPSLKIEFKDNNIAYLKLYQFSEKALYDLQNAAVSILNSDAQRIILDLRNNPGGYLEVAQNIAGWFLEKGQVVTIEDFGEGKEQNLYKAEGNALLLRYPIVVLINQGSASAAEILAGCLRDDRGIKLIGETSFGKGSVQELENLQGGSSLKVTIAKWLTPNGEFLTGKGLEPDIKVEMTEQDYKDGKDPQLDRAIEIIKSLQ